MTEQEPNFEQPHLYSISVDEFKSPPERTISYKVGDEITRANFINFLIHSFAISRGNATAQVLFMEWFKFKQGFDYLTTLTNFVEAGDFAAVSSEEYDLFAQNYSHVKKHGGDSDHPEYPDAIRDGVLNLVEHAEDPQVIVEIPPLESFHSYEEFMEVLSAYIKKEKDKQNGLVALDEME